MRFLVGFNWLILAASTTMATVLSVVLLIYWVYRDEPIIQASYDSLLTQTGMFVGLAIFAAAATLTLRKRLTGFWIMQVLQCAILVAVVRFYLPDTTV